VTAPPLMAPDEVGFSTLTHHLPGTVRSSAVARTHVRDALVRFPVEVNDTAQLLVSELVTNAVLHAGPPLELRIHLDTKRVLVAVEDASSVYPHPRDPAESDSNGRGLLLVDKLSTSWGWHRVDGGKRVWFEL